MIITVEDQILDTRSENVKEVYCDEHDEQFYVKYTSEGPPILNKGVENTIKH